MWRNPFPGYRVVSRLKQQVATPKKTALKVTRETPPKDQDTRKKVHSRAYHQALTAAKKSGAPEPRCKELAREAGRRAVEEWRS